MPPSTQESIKLSCPAKVNLALSVGSPDERGMHPIASWMVAVTFADAMTLAMAEGESEYDIAFVNDEQSPREGEGLAAEDGSGAAGGEATGSRVVDWPLESDLAYRAHRLLEERIGKALPIKLTLRKRIPPGAGLGGGSSNAAGMLVGLKRLYDLDIADTALIELGATLGSDVAFAAAAAAGSPSAIVTGLGNELAPARCKQVIHLVLILPPLTCPTAAVYRAFDDVHGYATSDRASNSDTGAGAAPGAPSDPSPLRGRSGGGDEPHDDHSAPDSQENPHAQPRGDVHSASQAQPNPQSPSPNPSLKGGGSEQAARVPDLAAVRRLAAADPLPQDGPFNDLAAPACRVEPRLADARQRVRDALNLPVHITGSGAAMFLVAPSAITAAPLARKVTALTGLHAVATRTL